MMKPNVTKKQIPVELKTLKKQGSNGDVNGSPAQVVRVKFHHPEAKVVAIAGTFNEWRPDITPMVAMGEGEWLKELVLPPGTYEYLFVADGTWLADPLASKEVPNAFGGMNSVLTVSRRKRNGGKRYHPS
jgi:hypothetical protein